MNASTPIKHRLSGIDWERQSATCSVCGPGTGVYVWEENIGGGRTGRRRKARCVFGERLRQRQRYHQMTGSDPRTETAEQRRARLIAAERERVAQEEAEERRTRFIAEERARIAREEAEGGENPYR